MESMSDQQRRPGRYPAEMRERAVRMVLEYVDWFNNRRRHGEILDGPGYTTPADHEKAYYRQLVAANQAATQHQ